MSPEASGGGGSRQAAEPDPAGLRPAVQQGSGNTRSSRRRGTGGAPGGRLLGRPADGPRPNPQGPPDRRSGAVVRSLGDPPLGPNPATAAHHLTAIYEEAVKAATASPRPTACGDGRGSLARRPPLPTKRHPVGQGVLPHGGHQASTDCSRARRSAAMSTWRAIDAATRNSPTQKTEGSTADHISSPGRWCRRQAHCGVDDAARLAGQRRLHPRAAWRGAWRAARNTSR